MSDYAHRADEAHERKLARARELVASWQTIDNEEDK